MRSANARQTGRTRQTTPSSRGARVRRRGPQFHTGLAYAGSGLGYQAASLIAGGPAPLLAAWMLPNFGWQAISVYILACAVVTLTAVILLPDRSKATVALTPILTPSASRLRSN